MRLLALLLAAVLLTGCQSTQVSDESSPSKPRLTMGHGSDAQLDRAIERFNLLREDLTVPEALSLLGLSQCADCTVQESHSGNGGTVSYAWWDGRRIEVFYWDTGTNSTRVTGVTSGDNRWSSNVFGAK